MPALLEHCSLGREQPKLIARRHEDSRHHANQQDREPSSAQPQASRGETDAETGWTRVGEQSQWRIVGIVG